MSERGPGSPDERVAPMSSEQPRGSAVGTAAHAASTAVSESSTVVEGDAEAQPTTQPSSERVACAQTQPASAVAPQSGLAEGLRALCRAPAVLCVALIRVYQRAISPMLGDVCRYHPSCSRYAVGAISTHGVFKGVVLAARRLLRCTPLHAGGLDPVPPRGAWKPRIEPDGRVRA